MTDPSTHLRLAGVTRLQIDGRGPRDAYVFDPHRLALPCWALALEERAPPQVATLLTFDRHLDLVAPREPARIPDRSAGVLALDAHTRLELDVRNVDHIVASMEAGLLGDARVVAHTRPRGTLEGEGYRDTRGREHHWHVEPTLLQLLARGGIPPGGPVLLDIDLDAFTRPSALEPGELLPFSREEIRAYLLPKGSEAFWESVLARTIALTLAREPYHCGGLVAAGRLFEDAAHVIFEELLGADLP